MWLHFAQAGPNYKLISQGTIEFSENVPYSGKLFERENFHKLVKKTIFAGKIFMDCSLLLPTDAMPPNLTEKTFVNSHKTVKFAKVFLLESFPLYGMVHTHYHQLKLQPTYTLVVVLSS